MRVDWEWIWFLIRWWLGWPLRFIIGFCEWLAFFQRNREGYALRWTMQRDIRELQKRIEDMNTR